MAGFESIGFRLDLLISGWVGWVAFALLILFVVLAIWVDEGWGFGALVFGLAALLALGYWFIALAPYDVKYHHVYAVDGRVTSVSNVLSESGGDLTRVPVVTLDSVDRPLTIEDPRAVTLEGKEVSLVCDVSWVFRGADRYECRIA